MEVFRVRSGGGEELLAAGLSFAESEELRDWFRYTTDGPKREDPGERRPGRRLRLLRGRLRVRRSNTMDLVASVRHKQQRMLSIRSVARLGALAFLLSPAISYGYATFSRSDGWS